MNQKERCISRSVNSEARGLKRTLLLTCAVAMVLSVAVPATTFAFTPDTITQDSTTPAMQESHEEAPGGRDASWGYGMAAIAAGLAVGLCALGTGFAQAKIGAAGGGALAEKPELSGVMIILVAIPETAVIMGFVIAISILGKL